MKTIIFRNMLTAVLPFFALALFSTTISVAQTSMLHANGKIAFTSDRDGNQEIYVMNADGTNQVRLTNNLVADDYPTWSPDGTKIALVSQRPSGGYAIYRMNADGTNRVEITPINVEASSSSMSWSPDGQRIVFDENSDIFVVKVDGGNRQNLTNGPEWDLEPSWSPDGSRILFSRYIYPDPSHVYGGTIMHTIRPDGTDLRELPNGQATDGWNDDYAKWSPSGDRVVFMGNVWDFFESIFIANADGTNRRLFDGCISAPCDEERLFDRLDRINPSWSPDGNWIIYHIANRFQTKVDIYVKNIDGTGFRQLTNTSGRNFNASWQPLLAPSVIDDPQFFVRQHYLDFLNRQPDADGLAFWTNEIMWCGSDQQCIGAKRINVSAAYFLSIEFQQTGYLVYRMYKSSYGNLPNAPVPIRLSEFVPDTRQIGQGVIVNQTGWEQRIENNKQAFATEFVQRSRFTSAYPTSLTPDQFVDTLFANAGVIPSASDRATAISEFASAMTTNDAAARARALRRVAENSTLAQQEFNRAFVLMQYFGYLRRNPNDSPEPTLDFQGYNFWLNKLDSFNGNFQNAEMVKAFIVSIEYRQRFGQP